MESSFTLVENPLVFRSMDTSQVDGVTLTDQEREYLLPHFLMLLVGKPGSGKTTLLKQLLTNPQMYHGKFDDVFIVSPSHAKMGIHVKQQNSTARFSLDWLFDKFDKINESQFESVFGHKIARSRKDKKDMMGKVYAKGEVMGDARSRFLLSDAFTGSGLSKARQQAQPLNAKQAAEMEEMHHAVSMQKKYADLKKMPKQTQEKTHRNVLVVLDDVVGQIKKAEFDPRLSQLVMNRRHIIFNGTVSLIMVTQKYTLIPARVRSNANWLILFQLNPLDFELAYRDCVTLSPHHWKSILFFVFGIDLTSKVLKTSKTSNDEETKEPPLEVEQVQAEPSLMEQLKAKKFENIGIWVESNVYFKNFKRIKL